MKLKDYKSKKYKLLPNDVYVRTLWTIRSYERIEKELQDMIDERHVEEVQVRNRTPGNPTAKIAERREKKLKELAAIDKALNTIPTEYQQMVYDNIVRYKPMHTISGASERTLSRYRMKVIVEVARNKGYIDDVEYEAIRQYQIRKG